MTTTPDRCMRAELFLLASGSGLPENYNAYTLPAPTSVCLRHAYTRRTRLTVEHVTLSGAVEPRHDHAVPFSVVTGVGGVVCLVAADKHVLPLNTLPPFTAPPDVTSGSVLIQFSGLN